MQIRLTLLAGAFWALSISSPLRLVAADRYQVVPLPFFGKRGAALNDHGVVAGGITNPDGSVSLGQWSSGVLTNLGSPLGLPREFNRVRPFGINNHGVIVGTIHTSAGDLPSRSFVYSGGRFSVLPLVNPTDLGGVAIGINSRGEVVGYDNPSRQSAEGWLWSNGAYSSLPVSGSNAALGINSSGTIVGNRTVDIIRRLLSGHYCCSGPSGYVVSRGTAQYLAGTVIAINDRGEAVGASPSGAGAKAAVFRNGTAIEILSVPSSAVGINSSGQVVGSYRSDGHNQHVFIWSVNSGALDLTPDGYRSGEAAAIDDRGDVLGFGDTMGGTFQYFLLTPSPDGALIPKALVGEPRRSGT